LLASPQAGQAIITEMRKRPFQLWKGKSLAEPVRNLTIRTRFVNYELAESREHVFQVRSSAAANHGRFIRGCCNLFARSRRPLPITADSHIGASSVCSCRRPCPERCPDAPVSTRERRDALRTLPRTRGDSSHHSLQPRDRRDDEAQLLRVLRHSPRRRRTFTTAVAVTVTPNTVATP